MVHFSARLRDNTYAEWRSDYLDYKSLKNALRKQRDGSTTSGSDGERHPTLLPRHSHTFRMSTSASSSELRRLLGPKSFEELLEAQYAKVERAYEKHLTQLTHQFALLQEHPATTQAARDSVRSTLMEMYRLLNQLLNFALLNYTGFVMILKKHDSMFPTEPSLLQAHDARLHALAFADATNCRALLGLVECMFADVFCQGDRVVAVASLMTRRGDVIEWAPATIGIKIGACLVLLAWVIWDTLVVSLFSTTRDRRILDLAATRAFPVYRSVGCCLLLHWLVGVSMYVCRHARVNYQYMFELNPRKTPRCTDMFTSATNMTIVYLINLLLYYKVVNGDFPEQIVPRGFYPLALFAYAIYFYLVRHLQRQRGLLQTLIEIIGSPFFPVTFFHVFVGNYLTSLVKLNQDLAWSVCFFASKEFLLSDDAAIDSTRLCHNNWVYVKVVVPLICALPLWWRFLQNLRRIHDTKTWMPHLPNASKYALAQVVALFGLFHPFYSTQTTGNAGGVEAFQVVWIALFTMSSLYTWAWDVWMDWGLGRPQYKFLSDRQMFSRVWVYYAAIVVDLFLCFAWTLTLIPPHSSLSLPLYLQPFTMVIELFRRTVWGIFRLENEHLRNTQGFRRVDFIPLHYDHGVGDDPLDDDHEPPVQRHVILMEMLLILFLVVGLSVFAIVEK